MNITSTVIGRVDCTGTYNEYSYHVVCENGNRQYYIIKQNGYKPNKDKVKEIKKQIDFALNLNLTPEILINLRLECLEHQIECLNNTTDKLHNIISKFEIAFDKNYED